MTKTMSGRKRCKTGLHDDCEDLPCPQLSYDRFQMTMPLRLTLSILIDHDFHGLLRTSSSSENPVENDAHKPTAHSDAVKQPATLSRYHITSRSNKSGRESPRRRLPFFFIICFSCLLFHCIIGEASHGHI